MSIVPAILSSDDARTAADAGDWAKVAAILSDANIPVHRGKVGGKATLSALVAAGHDPNPVIAAMRSVPMSSELLDTLTVSGVDWSDSLTQYVLSGLVTAGKISQGVADVVRGLSSSMTSLAGGTVTADECEREWKSHTLSQTWAECQNELINPAVGNRVALIAALRQSAALLEAG